MFSKNEIDEKLRAAGWSPTSLMEAASDDYSPMRDTDPRSRTIFIGSPPQKSHHDQSTTNVSLDIERLRAAGWSPTSLIDAAFDDSPLHLPVKSQYVPTKRPSTDIISTPTGHASEGLRERKIMDLRKTPMMRNLAAAISIDVTIPDSPQHTIDIDIDELTVDFRRQSLDPRSPAVVKKMDSGSFVDIRSSSSDQENIRPVRENVKMAPKGKAHMNPLSDPQHHRNEVGGQKSDVISAPVSLAVPVGVASSRSSTTTNPRPAQSTTTINQPPRSQAAAVITDQPAVKPQASLMREALIKAANLEEPLPNGWRLFAHQKEAVVRCLDMGRTIMAFDMGLGKTLISLVWAKAVCTVVRQGTVAVVVAPCTLQEVWRREATMLGFHVTSGSSSSKSCPVDEEGRPTLFLFSWSKPPTPGQFKQRFVLMADEAHAMQTFTSQRTQSVMGVCAQPNCIGVILATGTPMKNGRPANILPLLAAIRHPVARNKMEFEKRYCAARKTPYCPWDTSGASNLEELRQKIGPFLMRKTKEECLDLPPLHRKLVQLSIPQPVIDEYEGIIESMKRRSKGGAGSGSGASRGNSTALELMSQLRLFSSRAKVPGTARLIRQHFEEDSADPVVVFVWFKETAQSLMETLSQDTDDNEEDDGDDGKLGGKRRVQVRQGATAGCSSMIDLTCDGSGEGEDEGESTASNRRCCYGPLRCETLTGDILRHEERQHLVDRFQSGQLDVLICTFGVGSTGLTLTRSHTVILLDRPWTPGDTAQAEDRVRRIGQTSDVVESFWIEAFDMDKKLDLMLAGKAKNSNKVLCTQVTEGTSESSNTDSKSSTAASSKSRKKKEESSSTATTSMPGQKTLAGFFITSSSSSSSLSSKEGYAHNPGTEKLSAFGSSANQMTTPPSLSFGVDDEEEVDPSNVMSALLKQLIGRKK